MWGLASAIEAVRSVASAPVGAWARRLLRRLRPGPVLPLARRPFAQGREAGAPAPGRTVAPVLREVRWGLPGSWSVDPRSGHDFGEARSASIRARPSVFGADLLRVWVRGRGLDVLHAARCAARGEASGAAHVGQVVTDFGRRCPPGRGPQWSTAMEVALRAVRWLHALAHLGAGDEGPDAATAGARDALAAGLATHESWLLGHSDWRLHRTGNHHLVALAGTYLLEEHLAPTPSRQRRAAGAWRAFWRELRRQLGHDGVHFESSTHYHLLALECACHVLAAGRAAGRRPGSAAERRLRVAAEATAGLLRPDGSVAAIGDADESCLVELPDGSRAGDLADARPLAGWLAVLAGSSRLARIAASERATAAALWLGGEDMAGGLEELAGAGMRARERPRGQAPLGQAPAELAPACLLESGLVVLAVTEPAPLHVTLSATGPGRGGTGGHAHDDAGSYEVWAGGPLVVERGTGSYTGDPALRQRLRGCASQSVVQVDRLDQNGPVPGRPFRRRERAHPFLTEWSAENGGRVGIGHHGFFASHAGRVAAHRRAWLDGGRLRIEDELTGAGEHEVVLRVHWAPGLELVEGPPGPAGAATVVVRSGGRERATLSVRARGPGGALLSVEPAVVEVLHSPRQGVTCLAPCTEVRLRSPLPVVLEHELEPTGAAALHRPAGAGPDAPGARRGA